MPNTPVPAAATGWPDLRPPTFQSGISVPQAFSVGTPTPPVRFRLADDFSGPAGQLLAAMFAAQAARLRLEALQQRGGAHG